LNSISVVMPAYNEEKAIGEVIENFQEIDKIKEIIVANNNSEDNTAEIASDKGAQVIEEQRQGYGYAMKTALKAAEGDIIVSVESDQTYKTEDIHKLLEYLEEFDIVFGDRTNTAMIKKGAKMGVFLRFGNKVLGRMIQFLFGGPRITDVGCSYRAFRKDPLNKVLERDVEGPDLYSPQLIIQALKQDYDIVLVPVNYLERKGESKLTNKLTSSIYIGFKMTIYILIESIKKRLDRGIRSETER